MRTYCITYQNEGSEHIYHAMLITADCEFQALACFARKRHGKSTLIGITQEYTYKPGMPHYNAEMD